MHNSTRNTKTQRTRHNASRTTHQGAAGLRLVWQSLAELSGARHGLPEFAGPSCAGGAGGAQRLHRLDAKERHRLQQVRSCG
eukprot:8551436-Pyramimonas_sp.AAC.1